jgi:hypothetical protein
MGVADRVHCGKRRAHPADISTHLDGPLNYRLTLLRRGLLYTAAIKLAGDLCEKTSFLVACFRIMSCRTIPIRFAS